ncbi:MAG: hypothetical protein EB120_10945 [Proteobacteria bacterium]|nr:hypothetical protein [Pseudomonadota bacterium]
MKRKMKRFFDGGMPDFEREPLRDSSGNIVTDSSGQPVMSGSTPERARATSAPNIPPDRMSTLDPSDIEDAVRGRAMEAAARKPAQAAQAAQAAGTAGEDTGVGQLAGIKPKPPVKQPIKRPIKPAQKPMGRTAMGKTAEQEMEATKKAPAKKPADEKSLSSYAPDARSGRSTNVSYLRKDRLGMEPDMYIARRRMKEGFKSGGSVGSASKRADGIATKGKTRGRYI